MIAATLYDSRTWFIVFIVALCAIATIILAWLLLPSLGRRTVSSAPVEDPAVNQTPAPTGANLDWASTLHDLNDTLHGATAHHDDEFDPLSTAWRKPEHWQSALIFDELAERMQIRLVEFDPLTYDYPVYRDEMVPAILAVEILQERARIEDFYGWHKLATRELPLVTSPL